MDETDEDLDRTIGWLIHNYDVSVRLRNCVLMNPKIEAMAVREFYSDKENSLNALLSSRNFGRKSAAELVKLIEDFITQPNERRKQTLQNGNQTDIIADHPALDRTLDWLTQNCEVSVRLYNCIRANPEIAAMTIREVVYESARSHKVLFSIRNFGKTSATELFELCNRVLANRITLHSGLSEIEDETAEKASQKLLQILKDVPFPDSILQQDISARLHSVLKNIDADRIQIDNAGSETTGLSKVISDWPQFSRTFLKAQNCGRGTLEELEVKIIDAVNGTLLLRYGISNVAPITSLDCIIRGSLDPALIELLLGDDDPTSQVLSPPALDELVAELIANLAPREADVIQRRYGLNGSTSETLEEIGVRYDVTRERIRQVEAKAIRRLSHGVRGNKLKQSVDINFESLWSKLGKGAGAIFDGALREAKRQLQAEEVLAIDLAYGSVFSWLQHTAIHDNGAWFSSTEMRDKCASAALALRSIFEKQSLPFPLSACRLYDFSADLLIMAAKLEGFHVYRGYVSRRVGARGRRTVALHILLMRHWPHSVTLPDLVREYRDDQTLDLCSARDAMIVMQEAQHLFLHVTEARWSTVTRVLDNGSCSEMEEREPDDEVISEALSDVDQEAITIAAIFEQILHSTGPIRYNELKQIVKEKYVGDFAMTSIGPILLTSGRFIRIAPGMWALPSQVRAVASGEIIPSGMLAEDQCRWFVFGMRAGCKHGEFVAWNQRLELELCRWAETHAPAVLFEALLFVITPGNWTASKGDVEYWTRIKALKASYRLVQETPQLLAENIPLERLLAASQKIMADGTINWVSMNRVLFMRVDSTVAASALAILVAAGVLKPSRHWQDVHRQGERANEFFDALAAKWSLNGALSWSDVEGRDELEVCRLIADSGDLGWILKADIEGLFSELIQKSGAPAITDNGENEDSLESLLARRKENKRKQLLEKLTGQIEAPQSGWRLIKNMQTRNLDE